MRILRFVVFPQLKSVNQILKFLPRLSRDNFVLICEGYLFIEKEGVYNLRSWSDDGSIVYLNDEKIIDNDGSHSITMKEYQANLSEGYYKVRIEYFNGAGGKFLSFNWKKPYWIIVAI